MRAKYTAHTVRDGDRWAISVPEIRGGYSQARRLDRVEPMARDAIALMLDAPADSFDVVVDVELGDALHGRIEAAIVARRRADVADREASATVREAARLLLASGVTVRNAGRLLRVSHQRIAQLAPQRSAAARTAAGGQGGHSARVVVTRS